MNHDFAKLIRALNGRKIKDFSSDYDMTTRITRMARIYGRIRKTRDERTNRDSLILAAFFRHKEIWPDLVHEGAASLSRRFLYFG